MEDQGVASSLVKRLQVTERFLDHEVNVERPLRVRPHSCDERRAERDVRDEMAVHDIEMERVSAARFRGSDRVAQRREICTEERRRKAEPPAALRHERRHLVRVYIAASRSGGRLLWGREWVHVG